MTVLTNNKPSPSKDKLLYPTIFGGHYDEDDSYSTIRPNGRHDYLIIYTIDGAGYFHTSTGEKQCSVGEITFLRSGIPQQYGTVKGQRWNFIWIHFPELPEISYLPNDEVFIHSLPSGYLRERIYHIFLNLLHDSLNHSTFWSTLCENSLREIILLMAQRLSSKLDPRIEQTLQILSQSIQEPVRIHQLAQTVGLSVSRLSHLFKQEMGVSILDHLNQMRLKQAALLIEHMGRNASEASLEVGFNNYNHFADLFRKFYGVSPREYIRKSHHS